VNRTPSRPLEPWRWLGAPALLAIAATVLIAEPLRVFGLGLPEPVFPMVLAFAWATIRPSVLGPFMLVLVGVFLDLFSGAPLGLWPISLLIGYGVALIGRALMVGQETEVMAVYYAASTAAAFGSAYVLVGIAGHGQPNLIALAWQYAATMVLFPLVLMLRNRFRDADIRFR
jgi:rod shape-determining protein MreD